VSWIGIGLAVVGLGVGVYAWVEAGWLRTRVLDVVVPGLPVELDGLRIGHLSDFHFGAPLSRGNGAGRRAAAWVGSRRPDLVCITGDLVSHPRGEPRLREALALLERPYVVLGNHDVAETRDPFSRAAELADLEASVLLVDEVAETVVRGAHVQLVGVGPESYVRRLARPWALADTTADLRILLCHFPGVARTLPAGVFHLTLAGHLHAGQICLPLPGGRRVTLAHPRARYPAGPYTTPGGVMHVSPGTGTTFVPFRLFARPEVTELVLRRPGRDVVAA
jgi:predicted MPP superfamily phosphohydrolase